MVRAIASYFPWYGAAPRHSTYRHWDGGGSYSPPDSISAVSYPSLGPYDSRHPQVLAQHMRWLREVGIDALAVSWWGAGSYEDLAMPAILNAAHAHGLRVCVQIEPYVNRGITRTDSPANTARDLSYLHNRYGRHPAWLYVSRQTRYGSAEPRQLAFVFRARFEEARPNGSWAPALDSIRGTAHDTLVLLDTWGDRWGSPAGTIAEVLRTHADGGWVYEHSDVPAHNLLPPWSPDYIVVKSGGPGYDDRRKSPPGTTVIDREGGAYYRRSWEQVLAGNPELVTVSFNEWHEGTQIEPDQRRPNYAHHGRLYLDLTAEWITTYKTPDNHPWGVGDGFESQQNNADAVSIKGGAAGCTCGAQPEPMVVRPRRWISDPVEWTGGIDVPLTRTAHTGGCPLADEYYWYGVRLPEGPQRWHDATTGQRIGL